MVGHDIRNPLQAIASGVCLLGDYLDSMSKIEMKQSVKESLDRIQENAEYISKIVQDLQDYDRSLKLCEKQTDFEELCEKVCL
jgi:signal transduction histidine kinase